MLEPKWLRNGSVRSWPDQPKHDRRSVRFRSPKHGPRQQWVKCVRRSVSTWTRGQTTPKTTAKNPTIKVLLLWGEKPPSWSLWYLSRLSVSLSFRNLGWQRWVGSVAGETRAYMGQTETCPKVCPITMNSDETKWDRISPMSRTFLGGSGGRRGPHWVIWGVGRCKKNLKIGFEKLEQLSRSVRLRSPRLS